MKSTLKSKMLTVVEGIILDAALAYREHRVFRRDLERLRSLVEDRGEGLFLTLLPELDAALLRGLESGRLESGFPLSKANPGSKVPKFLQGLWRRIFNETTGCLLEDVDVDAIFFLRSISVAFKKYDIACPLVATAKEVKEYDQIDDSLYDSSLEWDGDRLRSVTRDGRNRHTISFQDCYPGNDSIFQPSLFKEKEEIDATQLCTSSGDRTSDRDSRSSRSWSFPGNGRRPMRGLRGEKSRAELLVWLDEACDLLSREIGPFFSGTAQCISWNPRERTIRAHTGYRHGPGAVAHGPATVDKYAFRHWSNKLRGSFGSAWVLPHVGNLELLNHELPSRLIAVRKTYRKPRLIAAEPMENMFCQQLVRDFLGRRVEQTFLGQYINFRRQELSSEMVVQASRDRSLATIDLSSASDRLSCWVVERAFRANPTLLDALHAGRTRWISNSIPGTDPFIRKLKKFASQGSATTFPVQSLVFLAVILAVAMSQGEDPRGLKGRVRVYGDDLIVPTEWYAMVCDLLSAIQLKVNPEKSYFKGNFRESCGMDAFMGYDVTPLKVKRLPTTNRSEHASAIDNVNSFFVKGLWTASERMRELAGGDQLVPIQHVSTASGSFASFVGDYLSHLKTRWNRDLQRLEYRCIVTKTSSEMKERDALSAVRRSIMLRRGPGDFLDSPDLVESRAVKYRAGWRTVAPCGAIRLPSW